jgi:hypothetical protein
MPEKARYVGGLSGRRNKITVDLCPQSVASLQEMLNGFNRAHGDVGISPIVRAAIIEFFRSGAWVQMNVEGLAAAKARARLREVAGGDQPSNQES